MKSRCISEDLSPSIERLEEGKAKIFGCNLTHYDQLVCSSILFFLCNTLVITQLSSSDGIPSDLIFLKTPMFGAGISVCRCVDIVGNMTQLYVVVLAGIHIQQFCGRFFSITSLGLSCGYIGSVVIYIIDIIHCHYPL